MSGLVEWIAGAAEGHGRAVLIEGTGKTSLLATARELAAERGVRTLAARGSELGRDVPFGAVTQLFGPDLPTLTGDPDANLHWLYWRLFALSERTPLLLAVDDLQWLDLPSARFLGYLARRLDGMRVLLCAATEEAPLDFPAETLQLTSKPRPSDVLQRLPTLGPGASELAHALAILDDGATLNQATLLSGLRDGTAASAAVALERAGIVDGLVFAHPLVRASIYDDIPPAERVDRHRTAAQVVPRDAVAAQLLRAGTPDAWAAGRLRAAAQRALLRGAPEHAVACLRLALQGPVDPAQTLFELGLAEAVAQDAAAAVEHLREARALATDEVQRAQVASILCELLIFGGDWEAAFELSTTARVELGGRDAALDLQLLTLSTASAAYEPRLISALELDELAEAALTGGAAGRPLALLLAAVHCNRGERLDAVRPLLAFGLDGGALLEQLHSEAWCFPQASMALVGLDELDAAEQLAAELLADARRRGSIRGFAVANGMELHVCGARGELDRVEVSLRTVLELVEEHGIAFAVPSALRWGLDLLLERPGAADLVAFALDYELPPVLATTVSGGWMLEVRARLRLQAGETAAGIEELRRAGRVFDSLGSENGWRAALALATRDEGLAREQLARAERSGLPRGIGVAQRTLGLLDGSPDRLRAAVELLAPTPARLEYARALVELGVALHERAPLSEGLELATACGATRLAERARSGLRAIGVHPPEALPVRNPFERRVAELAATGLSTPAIAQALFTTVANLKDPFRPE